VNERPELRLVIELDDGLVNVSFDMTESEREAALAACPDLPRVLNDSMSAMRRRYTNQKVATTGEASRHQLRAMAALLRAGILERAPALDCEVRAVYHDQAVVRRDAGSGRIL
jgi:hypothetical protein